MIVPIFFGDKPVYLCDELNDELKELLHHPDAVFIDELSSNAVNSLLHEIKNPDFHAAVVLHSDLKALKKAVWKHFKIIKAGGGLVLNEKNQILFIFRKGHWDLPKGKLDKGETIEECAVREVKEETGLNRIILGKALTTTFHTYDEFGKHILKESYWYFMKGDSEEELVPQTEESITAIGWKNQDELSSILPGAYPSIRQVIKQAGDFSASS
jgi:8-oxo-dGTP pyrophosphatase MutT (NUDIX family)